MNTHESYARRLDRTLPEPGTAPEAIQARDSSVDGPTDGPGDGRFDGSLDALAFYGDPSIPRSPLQTDHGPVDGATGRTIAWVRPSELPTMLGSSVGARGVDLHAELTRRTRRAPGAAASSAARRVTRTSIARPEHASPTTTTLEGPGL